jgi:hypothetical protein
MEQDFLVDDEALRDKLSFLGVNKQTDPEN